MTYPTYNIKFDELYKNKQMPFLYMNSLGDGVVQHKWTKDLYDAVPAKKLFSLADYGYKYIER